VKISTELAFELAGIVSDMEADVTSLHDLLSDLQDDDRPTKLASSEAGKAYRRENLVEEAIETFDSLCSNVHAFANLAKLDADVPA
jgi:hypothetical protein